MRVVHKHMNGKTFYGARSDAVISCNACNRHGSDISRRFRETQLTLDRSRSVTKLPHDVTRHARNLYDDLYLSREEHNEGGSAGLGHRARAELVPPPETLANIHRTFADGRGRASPRYTLRARAQACRREYGRSAPPRRSSQSTAAFRLVRLCFSSQPVLRGGTTIRPQYTAPDVSRSGGSIASDLPPPTIKTSTTRHQPQLKRRFLVFSRKPSIGTARAAGEYYAARPRPPRPRNRERGRTPPRSNQSPASFKLLLRLPRCVCMFFEDTVTFFSLFRGPPAFPPQRDDKVKWTPRGESTLQSLLRPCLKRESHAFSSLRNVTASNVARGMCIWISTRVRFELLRGFYCMPAV
ncbi:hypothetical protein DBV15_10826 [Temnothorax longispinosus]|uniref:Uncharacterized protein n=1 Tax=Temnothorax longispinosus TaxID=300112 RepID=A0A4S2L1L5_9HYME|nr:hypothetical protein DBV15_10826 [Temnothorax longispinosus]